jgi:hypothetical protein
MRNKHEHTWQAIFSRPMQAGILWRDIEAMLVALGAEVSERRGSRFVSL